MNKNYYKPIPCGQTIPLNNPHAFSVSMPTIKDVIDYEESRECSREKIKIAYPRIVIHPYIKQLSEHIKSDLKIKDSEIFLLPNLEVAKEAAKISKTNPEYLTYGMYVVVIFPVTSSDCICNYFAVMKHCGFMIFSREAEDQLRLLGLNVPSFQEEVLATNSYNTICNVLKEGYNTTDIILANSGMNGIYTGFNEIKKITALKNRELFILFGWAYADTIEIIKKCSSEYVILPDVNDISSLEKILSERGSEVSSIFVESVSNPLIEVPDIPRLHELSLKYGFYLMIDNTFATPWCVDINSYCDIIFESLTKFASGAGDVMAGSIIVPQTSRIPIATIENMKQNLIPPYIRDLERLAFNIQGYKERMVLVSKNSGIIEEYLLSLNIVKNLYSTNNNKNRANWKKISKNNFNCGILSIVFSERSEYLYNNMTLPKGPSLGTSFPLLMPYTLLAHYKDTKSKLGLELLKKVGLEPWLYRLSVGSDDPELTIRAIDKNL